MLLCAYYLHHKDQLIIQLIDFSFIYVINKLKHKIVFLFLSLFILFYIVIILLNYHSVL